MKIIDKISAATAHKNVKNGRPESNKNSLFTYFINLNRFLPVVFSLESPREKIFTRWTNLAPAGIIPMVVNLAVPRDPLVFEFQDLALTA